MATEEPAVNPMYVYIKGGIFPWTLEEFQEKIENTYYDVEDLGIISRPLYGLKVIGYLRDGIGKFVQSLPTPIMRSYYGFEIEKSSRIFVEEVQDGITVMMVSLENIEKDQRFEELVAL